MLWEDLAGGRLIVTRANSAVGFGDLVRSIFLNEVDAYPDSDDEEGDPATLAEAVR